MHNNCAGERGFSGSHIIVTQFEWIVWVSGTFKEPHQNPSVFWHLFTSKWKKSHYEKTPPVLTAWVIWYFYWEQHKLIGEKLDVDHVTVIMLRLAEI